MATVSLIVPCYNAANYLAATIDSVLQQDLADWELLLVDDGSRDGTWEIIERYAQGNSRVQGFRKENEGATKTRNFGYARTDPSSRYLFFLDHDDQLEPDALTRMVAYLDAHPEVGLLACQFQDVSADGRKLGTGKRSRWAPGRFFPHELRDDEIETPFAAFFCATGQGPFAMYRRSVYAQTDGWDTSFWPHEDTDMFCQMALLSKVHCLPEPLYLKRIHPGQGMSDGERVWRAYAAFRAKWNRRKARNAREAAVLKQARRYYHSMHCPCRDLKVARITARNFFARPNVADLRWGTALLRSAMRGFLFGRFQA